MILEEQIHKNIYRSYYRGQAKDWDSSKASFKNERFFTTDPFYACFYAYSENGIVAEYKLKNKVNIFNLKSKTDYFALHKYFVENQMNYMLGFLDKLKEGDWSFTLGSDSARQDVLNIIKSLGYDGFFNYEYNEEMKEIIENEKIGIKYPLTEKSPAIGVFNKNVFREVKKWNLEELKKQDFWEKYKTAEKEYLEKAFKRIASELNREKAQIKLLKKLENGFFLALSENEVLGLIEKCFEQNSPELLEKEHKKMKRIFSEIKRPLFYI